MKKRKYRPPPPQQTSVNVSGSLRVTRSASSFAGPNGFSAAAGVESPSNATAGNKRDPSTIAAPNQASTVDLNRNGLKHFLPARIAHRDDDGRRLFREVARDRPIDSPVRGHRHTGWAGV